MQADPDDYPACTGKLNYLKARWYGSDAEELDFARQCGQTRRWSSRMPLLICTTHYDLMSSAQNPDAYAKQPEVWNEVHPAYVRYLRQYPQDVEVRNAYAEWAWRSGHMGILNEQFTLLGDAVYPNEFGGDASLRKLKEWLVAYAPATTEP
jgi:hypothetical protein